MGDERYNMRNPAVKRILQEVREMQNNGSNEFMSLPVQDNIFEWQFAIRGPQDTEFEGGIYHGRIQLPPEYPFRPPAFMLLTPNGRFETQTKICLSISQHHPEHWQPSWSVRTALVALIAFMPTKPDGAIGSLDYTKEERRALAVKSRSAPPKFGHAERQQLIDEIHEFMLKNSPAVPSVSSESSPPPPAAASVKEDEARPEDSATNGARELEILENVGPDPQVGADRGVAAAVPTAVQTTTSQGRPQATVQNLGFMQRVQQADDLGLTLLAVGLVIAIIAILLKKMWANLVVPTTFGS
jgi:ubiquitin-conjugating enzyme E2 J1